MITTDVRKKTRTRNACKKKVEMLAFRQNFLLNN